MLFTSYSRFSTAEPVLLLPLLVWICLTEFMNENYTCTNEARDEKKKKHSIYNKQTAWWLLCGMLVRWCAYETLSLAVCVSVCLFFSYFRYVQIFFVFLFFFYGWKHVWLCDNEIMNTPKTPTTISMASE